MKIEIHMSGKVVAGRGLTGVPLNCDLEVFETTAPGRYDYSGTFEIMRYDPSTVDAKQKVHRLIAVPAWNVEGQTGRNRSGIHSMIAHDPKSDDSMFYGIDETKIVEILWARVQGPAVDD